MSYHIISIDESPCKLSVSRGQLLARSEHGTQQIPLEDVASIIISSLQCSMSNHFLISAARARISVIICDSYTPAALLLPTDRATDTALLRHLADMPAQLRRRLWEKTLTAKCLNQHKLASGWLPEHPSLEAFEQLARSNKENREGDCARRFWQLFAEAAGEATFRRGREAGGCNPLFNYAYAILLSCILRNLYALGIDPAFGICHSSRAHAAPLAYDLMEPFRPAFDANVMRWIRMQKEQGDDTWRQAESCITRDYRRHILGTLLAEVGEEEDTIPLRLAIERSIRSFRAAVLASQTTPYQAWKLTNIKWAGS